MIYDRKSLSYEGVQTIEEGGSLHKQASSVSSVPPTRAQRRNRIWTAHALMFGTFLLAAAVCVAHHVFLHVLNGRDVDSFAISQTWVRDIGNAFAWVAHWLLQISVGVALTQSIWLYVRRNRVTLNNLDVLFALPAFATIPSTLFSSSVLYVLILAAIIQAFSLVGIFAPSAMSVVSASAITANLRVPITSLDRIPATASSYFLQSSGSGDFYYMNPSSNFQRLARGVLDGSTIFPWTAPSECGRGCWYEVEYWGPALKCTDIPQSSIEVFNTNFTTFNAAKAALAPGIQVSNPTHYIEGAYAYNATTSFGYGTTWTDELVPIFQSYPYGLPFSLDVVYARNNFTLPFKLSDPVYYNMTGYTCTFHNASYTASIKYYNGSQTTTVRVKEYGEQLGPVPDPGVAKAEYVNGNNATFQSTYAAIGLASAMSQYVYGTMAFSTNSANDEPALAPVYTSMLSSVLTTPTSFDNGMNKLSLALVSPYYDNLARLLEDACTNLTASLMSDTADLGLYTQVDATVVPDHNVYRYQAPRLWLVYGIALGAALIADIYGLYCVQKNGRAMQCSFSSIAASVRNRDLDVLLNEPGEPLPKRAEKVGLRYRDGGGGGGGGEKAGFLFAEGGRVYGDDVEMSERAALKDGDGF
ncbi:unnamed protein product [Peniophora sp. CBMAI 1063]|nr:unnamed protein product [Peniophora sp. CBMAI 1063]